MSYTKKYTYPDAEFWIKFMKPEEVAYLILFSYANSKKDWKTKTENMLIPVEYVDGPKEISFEDTGENSGSVEMIIGVEGTECYVVLEGSYSGYASEGSSGSYYDPPEPGEEEMTDYEINMILYNDGDEIDEELSTAKVLAAKVDFTYADMEMLAENCMDSLSSIDTDKSLTARLKKSPTELPAGLVKRIEEIREENKRHITNNMTAKKYGI